MALRPLLFHVWTPPGALGAYFVIRTKPWCRVACSPVGCFNFSFLILTSLEQHYVMPLLSGLRVRGFFAFVIFRLTIALAIFSSKPGPRAGFVLDFRADCSECATRPSSAKGLMRGCARPYVCRPLLTTGRVQTNSVLSPFNSQSRVFCWIHA